MRFTILKENDGWVLAFAWFPFRIDNEIIFLEKYWKRDEGLYTNVRVFADKPF
jgi:hypothetical protein